MDKLRVIGSGRRRLEAQNSKWLSDWLIDGLTDWLTDQLNREGALLIWRTDLENAVNMPPATTAATATTAANRWNSSLPQVFFSFHLKIILFLGYKF